MHAIYETRYYNGNFPVTAFEAKDIDFIAHWHEDVELIYVCRGALRVGVNNDTRVLRQGDAAICSSGDIHYYDCRGLESVLRLIIFRPELIDSTGGWPRDFAFGSPFLQGQGNMVGGPFNACFETVLRETAAADEVSPLLIRSSLMGLCATLARSAAIEPIAADKASRRHHQLKGMQDALAYIERSYMDNIDLKDAAAVANMSVYYFSRLFGSVTGAGFREYLNRLRINKAEELLREGGDSITDIAYRCGFNSIRSFNRIFLEARGVPPSRMRR